MKYYVLLVLACVVARVLPHPANFAPVTALALFSGATLPRRYALVTVAAVMLLSDYALLYVSPYGTHLDTVYAPTALWHSSLPFVYLSFGISAGIGTLLRKASPSLILAGTLVCSLQFFFITNGAVWVVGAYDRSIVGLYEAWIAGIPFFRWTLLSDVLYTFIMFGLFQQLPRFSTPASTQVQTAGSD